MTKLPFDLCPKPAGANPCQGRSSDSSLLSRLPGLRASGIACGNRRLPQGRGLTAAGTVPDSHRIPFSSDGARAGPVPKPCGAKIRISREKKASLLAFFPRRSIFGEAKVRISREKKASSLVFFSEAEYLKGSAMEKEWTGTNPNCRRPGKRSRQAKSAVTAPQPKTRENPEKALRNAAFSGFRSRSPPPPYHM